MATKVILDTDIGGDIDDTWALAMMLKCPELDVKMIVSDSGNTNYRAQIIGKMLEVAKRTDIEIGIGVKFSDNLGTQKTWVEGYDLSQYPGKVHDDGVDAMIKMIMNSADPITLICIGPVPNIGEALRREPRIAEKAKFVGMHGSVRLGYGGKSEISAEANVKNYTSDCQIAFAAPWDMVITPLDTCGLVRLKGEKYQKVIQSKDPLTKAVIENYQAWSQDLVDRKKGQDRSKEASSTLFDTVAVHLAFSTEFLKMEELGIKVTDDGFTLIDDNAKKMQVATEWTDLEAYEDYLVERMTAATVPATAAA